MAMEYLGPTIDIHCGGIDHVSVHHTNEIAQSEAATGKPYVRFWIHGEFLVLRAGKMSKSGGTFVTLQTLREKGYDPLDYRYLCLTAHYRTQLEFTYESLDSARKSLQTLRKEILAAQTVKGLTVSPQKVEAAQAKFQTAMEDDLNAPKALAVVWEVLRASELNAAEKVEFVQFADGILALDLFRIPEPKQEELPQEVQDILQERATARKAKDYKKSDELRDKLTALGYRVKDTPQGQQAEKI